ncbi:ABC transporter permease [Nocardia puris]|uniref:Phospholipid/cholesterol/gamma-HCH transport system permease protein n=1 Tax=Nocardia puris TaxID=208602 RepID=A0A366E3J7_9NOCA|nr:ABC transporter permease [Nocardia puris]MBF6209642.1 ABC transporter permease [Nocardia puris]MBF6366214.1 ABC transporter permease [Nocardia puris]MBF6458447.1 ABC transporter permease [Nocardia puris]RBO96094.1 phospholipid/cholesterol/gamma-HCH transport system permease protein [Nocardia puris]
MSLSAPGAPEQATLFGTAVRSVTDTGFGAIRTFGRAVELAVHAVCVAVADLVTRRFQWREMWQQSWYLITVTAVPAILMAIPFGVIVSVQVGNLIQQFGADSLVGAAGGLGVVKRGAPLATGLMLAGAGASAIAADLGARTIRDEIDAMRVMGIDPIPRLVVPRVVAAVIVAPLLNVLIMAVGIASGYAMAVTVQGVTSGGYWLSFGSFTVLADVWISLGKAMLFGFLVAVIACQRGLEARGGPRGVADGVNGAVVLSVVSIAVVDVAATQLVTMFLPVRVA